MYDSIWLCMNMYDYAIISIFLNVLNFVWLWLTHAVMHKFCACLFYFPKYFGLPSFSFALLCTLLVIFPPSPAYEDYVIFARSLL